MFERLTKELWNGCPFVEFSHFVELDGAEAKIFEERCAHPVVVGKSVDRLAAYEDTGLTPEQIQAQQQKIEWLKEKNKKLNNENISKQLQKEKLLQEVNEQVEQIKLLEEVAKDLYFAYINKDEDFPHSFETKAIEKYKALLGGAKDGK